MSTRYNHGRIKAALTGAPVGKWIHAPANLKALHSLASRYKMAGQIVTRKTTAGLLMFRLPTPPTL